MRTTSPYRSVPQTGSSLMSFVHEKDSVVKELITCPPLGNWNNMLVYSRLLEVLQLDFSPVWTKLICLQNLYFIMRGLWTLWYPAHVQWEMLLCSDCRCTPLMAKCLLWLQFCQLLDSDGSLEQEVRKRASPSYFNKRILTETTSLYVVDKHFPSLKGKSCTKTSTYK